MKIEISDPPLKSLHSCQDGLFNNHSWFLHQAKVPWSFVDRQHSYSSGIWFGYDSSFQQWIWTSYCDARFSKVTLIYSSGLPLLYLIGFGYMALMLLVRSLRIGWKEPGELCRRFLHLAEAHQGFLNALESTHLRYWADKITLLWYSKRPPHYDAVLAKNAAEAMLLGSCDQLRLGIGVYQTWTPQGPQKC